MRYTNELHEQKSPEYRFLYALKRNLVSQFLSAMDNPRKTQQKRLQRILSLFKGSAFAKEHDLHNVRSFSDFRRSAPSQTHQELYPWLQRVAMGEANVLVKERTTALMETSGTTSVPKHIPVTRSWAKSIADAQSLWVLSMVHDIPQVARGQALTMVSPAVHGHSSGGIPIGSNTGRMHQEQPWWVQNNYPIPYEVFSLKPSIVKQYVILRFALQANISSWTTANPSMVLLMTRRLEEWKDDLQLDLRGGTLRHGPASLLSEEKRAHLEKKLIKAASPFCWKPANIWPLACVNCWKGGPAQFFVEQLPNALGGDIPIREVGITASEGYFALPLGRDWGGGVLWTMGHILEFVDESENCYFAWELEIHKRYRLIITTESGLYRYDLKDVIEVVGFCQNTPVIRFVGKYGRFLNALGEKVSEEQISMAVQQSRKSEDRIIGFTARIVWGDRPSFQVAVEGDLSIGFGERLEENLRSINLEYDSKRESGRMVTLSLLALRKGTYDRFRRLKTERGAPDGQLKDPLIALNDAEWNCIWSAHQESDS